MVKGVEVADFEMFKDLMLVNQLMRRVTPNVHKHLVERNYAYIYNIYRRIIIP